MYSEKVMDHFPNPRNVGEIPDADGVGTVGNPKCGDIMKNVSENRKRRHHRCQIQNLRLRGRCRDKQHGNRAC